MTYCEQCGAKLTDAAHFCPNCGEPSPAHGINAGRVKPSGMQPPGAAGREEFTPESGTLDVSQGKLYSVFAYFGFLLLVPLFASRQSAFIRYHTNQGLALLISAAASAAGIGILSAVFLAVSVRLYAVIALLWAAWWITLTAEALIGVMNAASGRKKPLPVIGGLALLRS